MRVHLPSSKTCSPIRSSSRPEDKATLGLDYSDKSRQVIYKQIELLTRADRQGMINVTCMSVLLLLTLSQPCIADICDALGSTRDRVKPALQWLASRGYIDNSKEARDGARYRYYLLADGEQLVRDIFAAPNCG